MLIVISLILTTEAERLLCLWLYVFVIVCSLLIWFIESIYGTTRFLSIWPSDLLFHVTPQAPTCSAYIIIKFIKLILGLNAFLRFPPEGLYYRWLNEMPHFNFMTVWSNRLLNANKINCLRVDAFQDLHNLNLLSLYDNKLQTVAKGTFSALRAIQTMYVCKIWTEYNAGYSHCECASRVPCK